MKAGTLKVEVSVQTPQAVKLGDRVWHGLEQMDAIVIGRTEYLFSLTRVRLQPLKRENGQPMTPYWADEIEVLPYSMVRPQE